MSTSPTDHMYTIARSSPDEGLRATASGQRRASHRFASMTNVLAALLGALIGLTGVLTGAWLNARREDRRWLRDQRLRAAIDFLSSCGLLYQRQRQVHTELTAEQKIEHRHVVQTSRSALLLLCSAQTADLADRLAQTVHRASPDTTPDDHAATISLLRQLTEQLRIELHVDSARTLTGSPRRPS